MPYENSLGFEAAKPAAARVGFRHWLRAVNHPGWLVVLAFILAYAGAQSLVYVEGDDAATVAYHALGREAAIQPPYSSYNGMMDFLLQLLPARETVVRVVALTLSSLAAVGFVLLALRVALDWLGELRRKQQLWIAGLSLLAVPELFFFGLVYTPNVVGMCFILWGHLVLRRAWPGQCVGREWDGHRWGRVLASLVLYGFGVACRWETAAYGLVIVVDLWLGTGQQRFRRPSFSQLLFGMAWGVLALVSAFLFIVVSGYGWGDILAWVEMSRQASAGHFDTGFTFFSFVGRHQTFFTPVGMGLCAVGLAVLGWRYPALAVKAVIGFIPLIPLFYRGAPKLLLPMVPGLLLCLGQGVLSLCFASWPDRRLLAARAVVLVVALAPWFVGVRVFSWDTQWGPGFEVRVSHGQEQVPAAVPGNDRERTIGISNLKLAWADGFAVATPEGPRPVGGYGAVVFGGGWRNLVERLEEERRLVISRAAALGLPVLQDDGNSLIVVHLLELGYATADPRKRFAHGFNERKFSNHSGHQVRVWQLQERPSLFEGEQLQRLIREGGVERVVFYSNYSSSLQRLFRLAPEAAAALGPFSAVVDLVRLHEDLSGGPVPEN